MSGLPPVLEMDDTIERLVETVPASVRADVQQLRREYEILKSKDASGRESAVDDMSNTALHLREVIDDPNAGRLVESIEAQLNEYRRTRRQVSETLHLSGVRFRSGDHAVSPTAAAGETVDLSATVVNQGETSGALVRLVFYHDDVAVRTVTLPMGRVEAGERKQMSTGVYVPSPTTDHSVTVVDPAEERSFLSDDELRRVRG